MARYILRRIGAGILTIWFVMTITFILMISLPGDPFVGDRQIPVATKKALYAKYGLDRSTFYQYCTYIKNYLKGDFGISFQKLGVTTKDYIKSGFPYSAKIGIFAIVLVILIGIPTGVMAALRQNKVYDRVAMVLCTLGATIPGFVLATLYLYIFSNKLGWVPPRGVKELTGYIGPAFSLSVLSIAFVTRLTRTSLLDTLQQDYIRTARAKGLSQKTVIYKHALRNSLIPVVTYMGPLVAMLLTGGFVVEKVFGISGMGSAFVVSITNRDYTVVMGVTVFFAIFLVLAVLIVDVLYVFIDPRIKYE